MSRRVLIGLVVALTAGVLAGSGLAGLSSPLPNDACADFGSLPEGSTSGGSLELWPLGNRCEYYVGSRLARTTRFGPTTAELYAWIVAATLLAALALFRRGSAAARGAATAAVLLALAGAGWHFAGVVFALFAPAIFGIPLACAVDHLLRPPGTRALGRSMLLAALLGALTFCAVFGVIVSPLVGIAFGIAAGSLASALLERSSRARSVEPGSPRSLRPRLGR
ncbi:MAG: hypothetical protein Q8K79_09515 [Solirubrobacteraceae bacterium]|nr:hypothetical protein [Solirubrobacteraceae bacterium]